VHTATVSRLHKNLTPSALACCLGRSLEKADTRKVAAIAWALQATTNQNKPQFSMAAHNMKPFPIKGKPLSHKQRAMPHMRRVLPRARAYSMAIDK
jgi:hypothetical protein